MTTTYAPTFARKLPATLVTLAEPKARQSRKAPKRKKGYWYCAKRCRWFQTIAGRQIPLTDKCDKTPETEALAARKVMAGKLTNDPNPTLSVGELAEKYLAARKGGRKPLRANTHKTARFCLNQFVKAFGKVRVAALEPRHLERWADDNAGKLSKSYINTVLGWARAAFLWGIRNGETTNNPMRGVEVPESERRELPDNIAEILDAIAAVAQKKNARFADWFNALRWSGARPSEICLLTVEMVKDHGDYISATLPKGMDKTSGKTGRLRKVYFFAPQAVALIRRLVSQRQTGRLFLSKRGCPMNAHGANCVLKRCRKHTGFKGLEYKAVAYACRHVFITTAIANKIPVAIIAECVGNSVQVLTRHYSHLLDDHIATQFMASGMFASKAG